MVIINFTPMDDTPGNVLYAARTTCVVTQQYSVTSCFRNQTPHSGVKGIPSRAHIKQAGARTRLAALTEHLPNLFEPVICNVPTEDNHPAKILKKLPGRKGIEEFLKPNVHNIREC